MKASKATCRLTGRTTAGRGNARSAEPERAQRRVIARLNVSSGRLALAMTFWAGIE
jgi:hypothetical protein